MAQFLRKYQLDITDSTNGLQFSIDSLRIQFKIKAGVSKAPNTSEIKITNLNPTTRDSLHRALGAKIKLDAGYEGTSVATIFMGDVKKAYSKYEDVDWNTILEAGDGESLIQSDRIKISFAASTPTTQIIEQIAKQAGVGEGNLKDALAKGVAAGQLNPRGYSDMGNRLDVLNKIISTSGWQASIYNGNWLILGPATFIPGPMIVLNSESGMIGSPVNSTDIHKGGPTTLKVKCLLNNLIKPGSAIQIDDPQYQGQVYRVESLEHTGDNMDGNWVTESICKKVV